MFSFQIAKVEKLSKEQTSTITSWLMLRSRKTITIFLMVMRCLAHVEHLAKQEQDTNAKSHLTYLGCFTSTVELL